MRVFHLASLACLLLSIAGCGGAAADKGEKAAGEAATEQTAAVKRVATKNFPKLGDSLPPLDGGRLDNVAPPIGWQRLEKDSKFLTRFVIDKTSGNPPRILITAEDVAGTFSDDVTPDNVAAFAAVVAVEQEGKPLEEAVKPLVIGDNAFARFVTAARKGNRSVDRQMLVTQFDGRRYLIALEVWAGEQEMRKHRDAAYAVAAGLKFAKPGAAKPVDEKPEPIEEKPAEEKK